MIGCEGENFGDVIIILGLNFCRIVGILVRDLSLSCVLIIGSRCLYFCLVDLFSMRMLVLSLVSVLVIENLVIDSLSMVMCRLC